MRNNPLILLMIAVLMTACGSQANEKQDNAGKEKAVESKIEAKELINKAEAVKSEVIDLRNQALAINKKIKKSDLQNAQNRKLIVQADTVVLRFDTLYRKIESIKILVNPEVAPADDKALVKTFIQTGGAKKLLDQAAAMRTDVLAYEREGADAPELLTVIDDPEWKATYLKEKTLVEEYLLLTEFQKEIELAKNEMLNYLLERSE